jgi:hypothetical protein
VNVGVKVGAKVGSSVVVPLPTCKRLTPSPPLPLSPFPSALEDSDRVPFVTVGVKVGVSVGDSVGCKEGSKSVSFNGRVSFLPNSPRSVPFELGEAVGKSTDGTNVGTSVGASVLFVLVGESVGAIVLFVLVGESVGVLVVLLLPANTVGTSVGVMLDIDGNKVGLAEGATDGWRAGASEGDRVGKTVPIVLGEPTGTRVGFPGKNSGRMRMMN